MTATTMTVEEFKVTELGLLPKEWDVIRLGELIEEVREKNKSNFQYPVFTVSNVYGFMLSDDFFNKRVYSKKLDTYKIVRSDYFAYNPYRVNVGSLALFDHEVGLVSPAYVVFRVSKPEHLHPPFLYRLIKSPHYLDEIRRIAMSRGSVRKSLSFRDLSDFRIPLPPLPEQEKIAYVLSTVQTAIEKAEAVINAARELKESLMKHLFTYGPVSIDEAENVLLKETEIGMVPEAWSVKTLAESVKSIEYGYSISIPSEENMYGVLIISTADITKDGSILYNQVRRINPPKRLTERLLLRDGDLLFNWRNAPELVGKTAIYEEQPQRHIYASFIMRIRTDGSLSNSFLCYLLNYYRQNGVFLKLARRAVNQANYNRNEISVLRVPLPPLAVQQKTADILSGVDRRIEVEENKKKAFEALFKTLVSNFMTGKIRVNNLEVPV